MTSSHKISSRHGDGRGWSVFDLVRPFPPTPSPDSLMADIDAAIAASEHAHATALLSPTDIQQHIRQEKQQENKHQGKIRNPEDPVDNKSKTMSDLRLADEAYKAACADLASGRHEAALHSLRVALASCPLDKPSAIAKLRSLVSITESHLQHKQKQQQQQQ